MLYPHWVLFPSRLRKFRQGIAVHFLRKITQAVHRPTVLSFILELFESAGSARIKNPESEEYGEQIREGFVVRCFGAYEPATKQDHMSELVRHSCDQGERIFELCASQSHQHAFLFRRAGALGGRIMAKKPGAAS